MFPISHRTVRGSSAVSGHHISGDSSARRTGVPTPTAYAARCAARARPHAYSLGPIEHLEGRALLSTFAVTSLRNSGPGTLRSAIVQADHCSGQNTIKFAHGLTGTINLTSALPSLSSNIVINGPGASVLTVARSSASATPDFRIFTVSRGAAVKMTGLTITGGSASLGAGIENAGSLSLANMLINGNSAHDAGPPVTAGGGIANSGKLSITDSTISDNSVAGPGGYNLGYADGGGIDNSGKASISNSTISGNSVAGAAGSISYTPGDADGGGVDNSGMMSMSNTTISDNTLTGGPGDMLGGGGGTGQGGGIENSGTLTLTQSTLDGNLAAGNGYQSSARGGGVDNSGTVLVIDSTITDNNAQTSEFSFVSVPGAGWPTTARQRSPLRR